MKIKIILCICLAVCLTALGVSGFMLYNDYAQRQNDQNAFEQLNEVTRATNDESIDEAVSDETTLPNTTESTMGVKGVSADNRRTGDPVTAR